MEYPFEVIEKKWQKKWKEKRIFNAVDFSDKPKYYVLNMFPYPSGALHMGHVSNYSIGDAITRFKLMQGYNVMQPMGYDAFGMPAENFAIQHNSHPRLTTEKNMEIMGKQFEDFGFGIDWDRPVATCKPEYYKWGQWLFKKLYENGLAYKKTSFVNWCDECQTVLANEQVEDGNCWRCGTVVRQKELEQWFFRITKYAEELLDFSHMIDWPERVMVMQENWIGKSFGTEIFFKLENSDTIIKVFTTRPDTIFGVTFMALPPEHPLVREWLEKEPADSKLRVFCDKVINEDKINRTSEDTTKEGVFSGRYCINPVNGDKVQIWITNYVLMDYGTGAVMAVPAHDQRDFEFAGKYDIPMKIVIQNEDQDLVLEKMKKAYTSPGYMVNSEKFNGLASNMAKEKITQWLQLENYGSGTVTYRLRDWGVSRQRYWGNPIPVIYCDHCGVVLVPDEDLPVLLPENVQIGKTTQNPLLSVPEWINVPCPKCGAPARRETDTMDTFVDSSWYYARYTDPKNDNKPFDTAKSDYWLPVDQYIGGIEHACMHLLYARFFHKFMRDIGLVKSDEPFARLLTQGMVTKDGAKMSKSKGNTVDPQTYLDRFGSDTARVFMLFASPPEKDVEWNDDGVVGAFRFLNRIWRLIESQQELIRKHYDLLAEHDDLRKEIADLRYSTHFMIRKWNEDIENRMQFNTAIAAIMEHLNNVTNIKQPDALTNVEKAVYAEACIMMPRLLYIFAPHISEELWSMLGNETFIHEAGIPTHKEEYLVKDLITYVIQVNGKVRGKLSVSPDIENEDLERQAVTNENVAKMLEGHQVKKIFIVPNKLVNIVI
ncbi:MAG TPA: leucine--tRNA ligase [Candidatus Cloacimonadota bacterium]|nr:leucine--tRNA ligase [Candidatus Cloacimonadota bacterium]